jgi:hypothetical protein
MPPGRTSPGRGDERAVRREARRATHNTPRGAQLRVALRRLPRAAWVCAAIAILNAICWSIVTPPFQAVDEPDHFAYVQHLAATGHLPSSDGKTYPPAETIALYYLLNSQVRFSQENHTIATGIEQFELEHAVEPSLERSSPGGAGDAAAEPPLYYALETLPYALGAGGTVLDSLLPMRLCSALFAGLTALFAFLFLREALPRARWAWTVGGLGVALNPVLGMMSGAVNPDGLLFALSTALFYCLARGFRRGLTPRLAIATGAVLALGCLTKLIFLAVLPGALFGLVLLSIRQARRSATPLKRTLAPALAIALAPLGAWLLRDALAGKLTQHVLTGGTRLKHSESLPDAFVYIWQLYLPRLPGMRAALHGISGPQIWFEQLVGKYGWLDTTFPRWVLKVALVPVGIVLALLARALVVGRRTLNARRAELLTYALIFLGLCAIVGIDEYVNRIPGEYAQLRYLLPAIALLGATLALAARGAGRRWGPLAGTLIVLLVLAHDIFSQLLVVSRYYG